MQQLILVFDLVGVLFHINKFKVLKQVGFLRLLRFILTNRKNPVDRFFELADIIAHQEGLEGKVKYKHYFLPESMSQWLLGFKSSHEAAKEMKQHMVRLEKSLFASNAEKNLMFRICDQIFDLFDDVSPDRKIWNLIKKLKNQHKHKVFLLTNIDSDTIAELKKDYKSLFSLFDGIVASCDHHLMKPQPAIYYYLLKTYKLDPSHCVFIDDQKENVLAAEKTGMKGIQYTGFCSFERKLKELNIC